MLGQNKHKISLQSSTTLPYQEAQDIPFQTFDTVAQEEPLSLEENKGKKKIVKEEIMIHVLRRAKIKLS